MKSFQLLLTLIVAISCDGQHRNILPKGNIQLSDQLGICLNCATRAFSASDSTSAMKRVFKNEDIIVAQNAGKSFWDLSPARFKVQLAFYHYLKNNAPKYDQNLLVYISRRDTALFCYRQGKYTPDTPLPIMSASKAVTAAVVMTLVEAGKLSLDSRVSEYIPSFRNEKKSITIRQLLTHTSGLVTDSPFDTRSNITLRQSVDSVALKTKLLFTPGTQSHYGSVSFSVASRVAEIVEKKPWASIFHERIGAKCGMENVIYSPDHPANPTTGHGIVCSMNEYLQFLSMIYNRGIYKGRRVLTEASVATMEADNTHDIDPTYGLGLFRSEFKGSVAREVACMSATGIHGWINREKHYYGLIFTQAGFDNTIQSNLNFRKLVREKL